MKLEFSRQIHENHSNFKKIRPVGTELFLTDGGRDGQTGMTKLAFRNFVNELKDLKLQFWRHSCKVSSRNV